MHLESSRWLITRFVVPEPYRNREIGTELAREMFAWADEKRYTLEIQITFRPEAVNKGRLKRFLKKLGFRCGHLPDLFVQFPRSEQN